MSAVEPSGKDPDTKGNLIHRIPEIVIAKMARLIDPAPSKGFDEVG